MLPQPKVEVGANEFFGDSLLIEPDGCLISDRDPIQQDDANLLFRCEVIGVNLNNQSVRIKVVGAPDTSAGNLSLVGEQRAFIDRLSVGRPVAARFIRGGAASRVFVPVEPN